MLKQRPTWSYRTKVPGWSPGRARPRATSVSRISDTSSDLARAKRFASTAALTGAAAALSADSTAFARSARDLGQGIFDLGLPIFNLAAASCDFVNCGPRFCGELDFESGASVQEVICQPIVDMYLGPRAAWGKGKRAGEAEPSDSGRKARPTTGG